MNELAIVLGVLILLIVISVYDKIEDGRSCDKYTKYYDKIYYQVPELTTLDDDDDVVDLHSQTADTATRKQKTNDTSKPVEAMWQSKQSQGNPSREAVTFDDKAVAMALKSVVETGANKAQAGWQSIQG